MKCTERVLGQFKAGHRQQRPLRRNLNPEEWQKPVWTPDERRSEESTNAQVCGVKSNQTRVTLLVSRCLDQYTKQRNLGFLFGRIERKQAELASASFCPSDFPPPAFPSFFLVSLSSDFDKSELFLASDSANLSSYTCTWIQVTRSQWVVNKHSFPGWHIYWIQRTAPDFVRVHVSVRSCFRYD